MQWKKYIQIVEKKNIYIYIYTRRNRDIEKNIDSGEETQIVERNIDNRNNRSWKKYSQKIERQGKIKYRDSGKK